MSDTMPLADLMEQYTPGDEWSWPMEFESITEWFPHRLKDIRNSIKKHGIREPILLGNDGRVWDGHHRITAAHQLGLKTVPVQHAGDNDA